MDNKQALCINEKIVSNGKLFIAILRNVRPEEKLKKIQKYLDQGADINAGDANNKNNAPLHVAVARQEVQVVQLLLDKGADINTKNSENQTPLDIAKLLCTPDGKVIAEILQMHCGNSFLSSSNRQNLREVEESSPEVSRTKEYEYKKRSGTCGLSGQLYESKLLSLILFRALNNRIVTQFSLGTNIDGMGAFDDIVFRYVTSGETKAKVIFIQAKHRDDPAKDKITVEEMLKQNGDFSLHKYLDSYINIRQRFSPDNSDEVFRGAFHNTDCHFIIYTSAMEKCFKKKVKPPTEEQYFITTTDNGKIFQLEYDDRDVDMLLQSVVRSRASMLAKQLMKYILRDNCNNMMSDDLIKTYHVFLAQHVLALTSSASTSYHIGQFRETFLETKDNILLILKECICKELATLKNNISLLQRNKIEILKSLSFKVPAGFGNLNFRFVGNAQKRQRRLDYLFSTFQKIFRSAPRSRRALNDFVIIVDESIIGPNEILQDSDFEVYRLGGLVGNLLIHDTESKMLKFNMDEQSLPSDCTELREMLQVKGSMEFDLRRYRLDISYHGFPRLTLLHEEHDRQLVKMFLNDLKFYTNQAKEDVVENIAKQEIDKYYNAKVQNDSLFRLKTDAIFLKVHDKIQKWWKKPKSAPYLTENCKFYHESETEILRSPLLSILNFTFREKLKNISVQFDDIAVASLGIDSFLSSMEKVLVIHTAENKFTAIKLIQYFKATKCDGEYTFFDMDYVTSVDCFESVSTESRDSKVSGVLIVTCKDNTDSKDLNHKLNLLLQAFKGKVIIITNSVLATQFNFDVPIKDVVQNLDESNNFYNIIPNYRQSLLEQIIIYQGNEIPLNILLDQESTHFIDHNVLRKIIFESERISIGETLTSSAYDKTADCYVEQTVCRHVTLKSIDQKYDDLFIVHSSEVQASIPEGVKDVALIADNEKEFDNFCLQHKYVNVHWFRNEDKLFLWKQSRGEIATLMKYVCRGSNDSCMVRVKSLIDLEEKTVIISGEPGMGKSTLLTHLAIHTKHDNPMLWITKIKLIEYTDTFLKWKVNGTKINLKEVLKFMLGAVGLKIFKESEGVAKNALDNIVDSIIGLDQRTVECDIVNGTDNVSGLQLFEVKLFVHLYRTHKVALLLDGFDEICPDYAQEVMDMINILKDSKLAHFWITTRTYNILSKLEGALRFFSYAIQPLTPLNQYNFLQKFWFKKLGIEEELWWRTVYIEDFFNIISKALDDRNKEFTSIPLHLYMIAEVFQFLFKEYSDSTVMVLSDTYNHNLFKTLNLISLYGRFIDMKFIKIRFGEKKRFMPVGDPDVRILVERERATFFEIHKKISAYFIFDEDIVNEMLSEYESKEINDFIYRVKLGEEKTGIIERVIENKPRFVHLTFAEYFATELLWDKLNSPCCGPLLWKYLVNVVFVSDKRGVRRFFNSKLALGGYFIDITSNLRLRNVVFDTLLHQYNLPINSLFVAVDEFLTQTAIFILWCVRNVLTKDNLDDFIKIINKRCRGRCILCTAIERNMIGVVKLLVEMVKKLDESKIGALYNCEDMQEYKAHTIVTGSIDKILDAELLKFLYQDLPYNSYYLLNLFGAINMGEKVLFYVLKRLDNDRLERIFTATDLSGRSLAHYAAKMNDYNFFDALHNLFDSDRFRKICLTNDNSGFTPFYYFVPWLILPGRFRLKLYPKRYKELLAKVFVTSERNIHSGSRNLDEAQNSILYKIMSAIDMFSLCRDATRNTSCKAHP